MARSAHQPRREMAVTPLLRDTATDPSAEPASGESQVTARTKVGLGFGLVASQGPHNAVHTLSHQVLNMSLGMNPALITILSFSQRLWNAVLDPVFGRYSDNLRTRFGRRRPLMLFAAFPLAACFAVLWAFPRDLHGAGLFGYLLVASLCLYTAISAYSVALGGLQLAAAADYHERTRVVGFMQLCFLAFTVAIQWIFPAAESFGNPVSGLRWITLGLAVAFFGAALTPVFLVRERLYEQVAGTRPKLRLAGALLAARANPTFLRLITAQSITSLGFFLVSPLGAYINYYYLFPGDLRGGSVMQAWMGTTFQLTAFLAIFAFRRLSIRWGKLRTFQLALSLHVASTAFKLFAYQPDHPWFQIIIYIANGAAFAGTELLTASMLADIIDFAEWDSGTRSESVYWSLASFCDKTCGAVGILLSGFVLVWIGFRTGTGSGTHQSETTLRVMRYCYAGFPGACAIAAILIIRPFAITESSANQMKTLLERRRRLEA